jgi:hypothetical protein
MLNISLHSLHLLFMIVKKEKAVSSLFDKKEHILMANADRALMM